MIKIFLALALISLQTFSQTDSSLTLTEIMFNASSGNNEFIELFNLSYNDTIDLDGYKLKYEASAADVIADTGEGSLLLPRSFAVVLEADYDFANGIYNSIIPANALILKITDNAFGSSGMANTSSRTIALLRPNNDTLETYLYSANNGSAFSDEKITINKSNIATNWNNALYVNGTPGKKNSVTPNQIDLSLHKLFVSNNSVILGETFAINCVVKNIGTISVSNFEVKYFHDLNKDSLAQSPEEIFLLQVLSLAAGDSIEINFPYANQTAGTNIFIAKATAAGDEDSSNNISFTNMFGVTINEIRNDIVINEIMYAPASPQPEWIEIYNRSNKTINLKNYKLADAADTTVITSQSINLLPQEFAVIAKDSSINNFYNFASKLIVKNIPTLNNDVDEVILIDSINRVIDSLQYRSVWGGGAGFSLERVNADLPATDSTNWKTAVRQKATPGKKNSATKKDFDVAVAEILFSPSAPLKGEQVSIKTELNNLGNNNAIFSVKLFESTLRDSIPNLFLEESAQINLTANDSSSHTFNFNIVSLQSERMFIVKINFASDEDTLNNIAVGNISPGFAAGSIVVNEIMYSPINGEPEWIEIYNNSGDTIPLNNWKISDVVTTPVSSTIQNILLAPKTYCVFAKDSALFLYHQSIPSDVAIVSLATLNNDKDGVVLKDDRGITIDSVFFISSWGGTSGYSLERKIFSDPSNNQSNWASSVDIEYSTPGRVNSNAPKKYDLSLSSVSSEPRFPVAGDDVAIKAVVKNAGTKLSNVFLVKIFIITNGGVDSLFDSVSGAAIPSGDSLAIQSEKKITNIQSSLNIKISIEMNDDEDLFNNSLVKMISIGEKNKSVLISEIMYAPRGAEPEWIELYNNSNSILNLKNWSIGDFLPSATKTIISSQDYFLPADSFVVIAKDSSLQNYYSIDSKKIIVASFASLSNSADGVFVYDYRNAIIDSVIYKSEWGGQNGNSLERIFFEKNSNDSSNWFSSLDGERATPARVNSLSTISTIDHSKLVINEIMYDPDIDNCEYVELYNPTSDSFNIGGWKLVESGKNYFLSDSLRHIRAGEYFLIASDSMILNKYSIAGYKNILILNSSSFSLSNSGEILYVKNLYGKIIDSVEYAPDWHNKNFPATKNISLERINANINGNEKMNWSSSVSNSGGTPGASNSINISHEKFSSGLTIFPNPFSPDDDGFEDFTQINYTLPYSIAQIRIRIYDSKGRFIRTLVDAYPAGASGSIIFDGKDESGSALRIGIYIIYFEAVDQNSGAETKLKSAVVVARKL